MCYSLKNMVSKYLTYNTCACVLQIAQGVHLANAASKRHPEVLLAYVPSTVLASNTFGCLLDAQFAKWTPCFICNTYAKVL